MEIKRDLIYFDVKTKNGRIYSKNDINLTELISRIKNGSLYGEIDHPQRLEISLGNVSHLITDLELYGSILYGTIKILDTDKGRMLKELVKDNLVVFRPRGQGTVNPNGTVSNYKVLTFDAILSSDDAFFDITILRRCKINRLMEKIKNGK
jgi:hypothetical protein